ncbi:hypothetical protein SCLCIDRAFT_41414, partial [Scleroderma citrinum Foug A]
KVLSMAQIVTLVGSILVALCSGTSYVRPTYAPQLGARLHISHTQVNIVGLAGNFGIYVFGPVWDCIADARGTWIPLIGAFISLLVGYMGIKCIHNDDIGSGASISLVHFAIHVLCALLTGFGAIGGLSSTLSTTARSFPQSLHATATALVLSGFGLSVSFFTTIVH